MVKEMVSEMMGRLYERKMDDGEGKREEIEKIMDRKSEAKGREKQGFEKIERHLMF